MSAPAQKRLLGNEGRWREAGMRRNRDASEAPHFRKCDAVVVVIAACRPDAFVRSAESCAGSFRPRCRGDCFPPTATRQGREPAQMRRARIRRAAVDVRDTLGHLGRFRRGPAEHCAQFPASRRPAVTIENSPPNPAAGHPARSSLYLSKALPV
jgi:hypothetical protein